MKVLIVTNSSSGLYQFRRDLIKDIIKKNNKVEVITPNCGFINELKGLGCCLNILEMDRRGKNLIAEFKLIFKYRNLIKKINPDK
ncbi:glycosyltransferase family 4 protein, partial [Clostridium perfringens]|nr:glycosyltransferase family 4 protein [Clostridium perfringens]